VVRFYKSVCSRAYGIAVGQVLNLPIAVLQRAVLQHGRLPEPALHLLAVARTINFKPIQVKFGTVH